MLRSAVMDKCTGVSTHGLKTYPFHLFLERGNGKAHIAAQMGRVYGKQAIWLEHALGFEQEDLSVCGLGEVVAVKDIIEKHDID
jgi:hypothetical protein